MWKFFQEIRTETRISNINLKKTEKKNDLRWNFPKRSERKRVFLIIILRGDLVRNIYVWGGFFFGGGGGDMFRIIYLRGDVFRSIHRKLKFGGDIWRGGGGFVPYYIPEGGCVPYIFPDRRFYSDQPILHFVIVTYDFIYLINLFDQKWRIQNLPYFTFTAWFFEIFFITRNHGWRRCRARLYRQGC